MAKFIASDPRQPLLLPVDLREWVPSDDLSHFVLAAVERVSLDRFRINERGSGSAQYHPRMMLALLIYCYANGVFGSRRIERATYRDLGARYITADTHPDHDTICKFRRENFEADAQDLSEGQSLPEELARRGKLKAQLDAACARLEREAKGRAQRERSSYERKVAARDAREGRHKGRKIKPPKTTPQGKDLANLTNPDSGLMRKNKTSAYRQAYNAQCVVDAEGSQLIVGSRVNRKEV